jgi:adenylate cyclase
MHLAPTQCGWAPSFAGVRLWQLGQLEEARKEAAQVLRISPGLTIEKSKPLAVYRNPEDLEHNIDGLRKAGLPET